MLFNLLSIEDYEYFYEFVTECYDESQAKIEKNITQFSYVELERLKKNKEENLDYLAVYHQIKTNSLFILYPLSRQKK